MKKLRRLRSTTGGRGREGVALGTVICVTCMNRVSDDTLDLPPIHTSTFENHFTMSLTICDNDTILQVFYYLANFKVNR